MIFLVVLLCKVVPFYAACAMTKLSLSAAYQAEQYRKWIYEKTQPWFSRRDGRDFIFIMSSETYDFNTWATEIERSVKLVVEGNPFECDADYEYSAETAHEFSDRCRHDFGCFQPWMDIMIPGFVEDFSVRKMWSFEQPYERRNFLACTGFL